jgi:hypothetical protein
MTADQHGHRGPGKQVAPGFAPGANQTQTREAGDHAEIASLKACL